MSKLDLRQKTEPKTNTKKAILNPKETTTEENYLEIAENNQNNKELLTNVFQSILLMKWIDKQNSKK